MGMEMGRAQQEKRDDEGGQARPLSDGSTRGVPALPQSPAEPVPGPQSHRVLVPAAPTEVLDRYARPPMVSIATNTSSQ